MGINSLKEGQKAWRRLHRPEEYSVDAAKWLAGELGLPFMLVAPFAVAFKSVLARWEPAADEVSTLIPGPDGSHIFRTYFKITKYTGRTIYDLMESALKKLGVGSAALRQNPDTEFAWVLLGGVLTDYACRAGLCDCSTKRLLEFRMRNSDYFTATTWFNDCVEVTNLVTGRVERLELPPEEIKCVVDWSVRHHTVKPMGNTHEIKISTAEHVMLLDLEKKYAEIAAGTCTANHIPKHW